LSGRKNPRVFCCHREKHFDFLVFCVKEPMLGIMFVGVEWFDMLPTNDSGGGSDAISRITPDDELIKRLEVQRLMGGLSVSAVYDDPDLMRLKINVTAGGESPHAVRWIAREVLELRARRVARSEERAASIGARIEQRRALRRAKQRARTDAKPFAGQSTSPKSKGSS
jgi:hypothetical protein